VLHPPLRPIIVVRLFLGLEGATRLLQNARTILRKANPPIQMGEGVYAGTVAWLAATKEIDSDFSPNAMNAVDVNSVLLSTGILLGGGRWLATCRPGYRVKARRPVLVRAGRLGADWVTMTLRRQRHYFRRSTKSSSLYTR